MTGSWLTIVEGLVVQACLVATLWIVATRLGSAILHGSADVGDRIVVGGVVAIIGWVALLQVLGLAGLLWLPIVLACCGLAVLASHRFLARPAPLSWNIQSIPPMTVICFVPFVLLALAVTFLNPPVLDDSVRYHIVNAAQVLNSGSIRGLPFSQPGDGSGTAPGNGTLLLLLVLLPFHNASLAGTPNLFVSALIVAVIGLLVREMGRNMATGSVCGLVLVTSWGYFGWQIGSAYDDSLALFGIVAGVTFALRGSRSRELRWLAVAGACFGLALGTKAAYILPTFVALSVAAWLTDALVHPHRLAMILIPAVSLAAVWYLRNWVDAGDPVYPEAVRLGPITLFSGLRSSSTWRVVAQSLIGGLLHGHGITAAEWWRTAVIEFGIVPLTLAIGVVRGIATKEVPRAVSIIAIACTLTFLITPFTGSSQPPQVVAAIRFLLPAMAFGLATLAATVYDRTMVAMLIVALAFNGVSLALAEGTAAQILIVSSAAISTLLAKNRDLRRGVANVISPRIPGLGITAITGGLIVTAALRLQPPPEPRTISVALRDGPGSVVVMDVTNVQAVLGPNLHTPIVAAGIGPTGAQAPITTSAALTRRIVALHPAAVVVGDTGDPNVIPTGWKPPSSWQELGVESFGTVYEP
jgi:hypothetical protein